MICLWHLAVLNDPPQEPTKYVLDGHWLMEIYGDLWKFMEIVRTQGKRWNLPKLTIPLFKVMSLHFSNIYIGDTEMSAPMGRPAWLIAEAGLHIVV